MPSLPTMDPYAPHVLVCTRGYRSPDRRGRAIYAPLAPSLQREALARLAKNP